MSCRDSWTRIHATRTPRQSLACLRGSSAAALTTSRSAILTLAGAAFSLQQTMVFPALRTFQEEFGSSTAWTTWILTGFLVSAAVTTPILGRLGDQFGKERMLLVSLSLFLAGCLARGVRVEPLVADRLPRRLGSRRRALPAQLRDHPRRVPDGEDQGRNRPALRGLGHRRRLRDRPLRRDRRQLLVAAALPARLDPGRALARAHRPLRSGVAHSLAVADRRAGRAAALGRAAVPDGGAHRGRAVGLDVAAAVRSPRARRGVLRPLGCGRGALELADGRSPHAGAPADPAHEHRHAHLRLRALQLLRAPAGLRRDRRRPRLRLRRERHEGGPLPAAELGGDARRRPARRHDRAPLRLQVGARRRHARGQLRGAAVRRRPRRARGTSSSPAGCSGSASAPPSRRWRR